MSAARPRPPRVIAPEEVRRKALVDAVIREVGTAGTLDVTVARIARAAGMSPALAHHYFGSKEQMLLAAMRRLLKDFRAEVRARRAEAHGPRTRLSAVAKASFGAGQLDRAVISAWLLFYQQAQVSTDAARLLAVYRRRLHGMLMHDLRALLPQDAARRVALSFGALIDGFYLRQALGGTDPQAPDRAETEALAISALSAMIAAEGAQR
ncbi:MAG: TetR/AcrR family bet gene transcriptional repressor [Paracoccaceae bacterium]|jgi:TetR/AcrR family transcriptional repressor of bet genes